jgi:phenylacetic acid degradation operon negative regulatory protein
MSESREVSWLLPQTCELVAAFSAQKPPRLWSLIITLYGDAIVPRGGVVWLGTITLLMEAIGVESGAVRAAMSRLAADGWLTRQRDGKASFYALAEGGRQAFALASERIYAARPARWDGRWTIVTLPPMVMSERQRRVEALTRLGFGSLAGTTYLRPETAGALAVHGELDDLPWFEAEAGAAMSILRSLSAQAWPLDTLGRSYRQFIDRFAALDDALPASVSPLEAMVLRLMLIHNFRRSVLQDPMLPPALMPESWPGDRARHLAGTIYQQLVAKSEAWLDTHGRTPDGPLPSPVSTFRARFGGANGRRHA